MGFGRRIQYYLVHTLNYTNKQAKALITEQRVKIGNEIISTNVELRDNDEITVDGELVKVYQPVYIKFNKPIGFVSSLNENVKDSLYSLFKDQLPLFIAGRLDKQSEGLMILTNDGKWVKKTTDPKYNKEKEYIVTLSEQISADFTKKMSEGIDIGFHFTKPCKCWLIDEITFGIILTEGKNKQIRRMCKSLNRQVVSLKRIRIDNTSIDNQEVGTFSMLNIHNML